MDILKNLDLSQVLGGGYWWQDSAGYWHYNPSDEELMVMTSFGNSH